MRILIIISLLLLISFPSSQSVYQFSKDQQNDISHKIISFHEWLSEAYSKMRYAISRYAPQQGQKKVTFWDWNAITLPSESTIQEENLLKHFETIFEELDEYFHSLSDGKLKSERDVRKILEDLAEKFDKFRMEMSESLEAELEEKYRKTLQKGIKKTKNEEPSSSFRKEKWRGTILKLQGITMTEKEGESSFSSQQAKAEHQAESSSSRNIENEEKIDVHFLPVKINEKIYELNEQIWFQNYDPFFKLLKEEIKMEHDPILEFYQNTLESKRNGIREKNLDEKIAGIVEKVRKGIDKKSFTEMCNGVEIYLQEECSKIDGMNFRRGEKEKAEELMSRVRFFLNNLKEWQNGEYPIVNKMELIKLETVAEQMEEIARNEAGERGNAERLKNMGWNVPTVKNIEKDSIGSKLTALGRMTKFARNVVNEIEAEIAKKYENEAIKRELKRLYYTVLTNRATLEMTNYMANEFVWTKNFAQQRNKTPAHQQSTQQHFAPKAEHSEIKDEEIQTSEIASKKFTVENLALISILVDFLKNYLKKLDDKIKIRKLIFDFEDRKENLKIIEQKIMEPNAKFPPKEYIIEEEDNPLVQSIKSLYNDDHLHYVQTSNEYRELFPEYEPNRDFLKKFDFHLFEFGLGQNELPENFLDRHKANQQGMNLDVRVVVDTMNLLAIFSRLKHLMEKTGMNKIVLHFNKENGLEIKDKLKAEIENINGQRIPQNFAAFIYDKYVNSVQPNMENVRLDNQHLERPTRTILRRIHTSPSSLQSQQFSTHNMGNLDDSPPLEPTEAILRPTHISPSLPKIQSPEISTNLHSDDSHLEATRPILRSPQSSPKLEPIRTTIPRSSNTSPASPSSPHQSPSSQFSINLGMGDSPKLEPMRTILRRTQTSPSSSPHKSSSSPSETEFLTPPHQSLIASQTDEEENEDISDEFHQSDSDYEGDDEHNFQHKENVDQMTESSSKK